MNTKIQTVCPECASINRIAQDRLVDRPVCGVCKAPLLTGQPLALEVNGARFSRFLYKDELPLLVDFWAEWCGPCKMMAPAFSQVAGELKHRVRAIKINTEQNQSLAQQFQIRSIPTLMLFKQGREAGRQSGALNANSIKQWIESVI